MYTFSRVFNPSKFGDSIGYRISDSVALGIPKGDAFLLRQATQANKFERIAKRRKKILSLILAPLLYASVALWASDYVTLSLLQSLEDIPTREYFNEVM